MKAVVKWTLACVAAMGVAGAASAQENQTLQPQVVEQKPAAESSGGAAAGTTVTSCTNGKNKRTLHLTAGKPCEVHYKKETEVPGHDQILWSAKNDPAYCESKAKAFIEKLQGMGWTCSNG